MAAAALVLFHFALLVAQLALLAVTAQRSNVPACSQVGLQIRATPQTVRRGRRAVLTAKVTNKGPSTLSGLGIRVDLPTGLVAAEANASRGVPIVVNTGGTAYWRDLTLKPGKVRVLRIKARACATATSGAFPVGGAAYLLNATNDVTCLSRATTKPSTVRDDDDDDDDP